MLCKCGANMGSSESPSPYGLSIYYSYEVEAAIKANPLITLHDFLLDWDEINKCQHTYMQRKEPVDYWYCPTCHRVYEVQSQIGGRWLRVFLSSNNSKRLEDFSGWRRIYVMTEMSTDAATDKTPSILLAEYLKELTMPSFYISPNETKVYAVDLQTEQVVFVYELEDMWISSDCSN